MRLYDQYEKAGEWYAEIKINSYIYVLKFVANERYKYKYKQACFMGQAGYALNSFRKYESAE